MKSLGLGVVGTGGIAMVIANAAREAGGVSPIAVSSRNIIRAKEFANRHVGMIPVQGLSELLNLPGIDAIYIGTPTITKEEIALQAISSGKHVLVEKPFVSALSVDRIAQAAEKNKVIFMDATQFIFHPRTSIIKEISYEKLGIVNSLHASINFGGKQPDNIRLNPQLEPMGALGDLGWYAMSAIVEFLCPEDEPINSYITVVRDKMSRAIIRASGMLSFESTRIASFDVGYTSETAIMDLALTGTKGMISMDDFVLDWANSFAFHDSDSPAGFFYRNGMMSRSKFKFLTTPSEKSQEVLMLERFAKSALGHEESCFSEKIKQTQNYLDTVWSMI